MAVGQKATERNHCPGALPQCYDEYRRWRKDRRHNIWSPNTTNDPIWPTAMVIIARCNAPGTRTPQHPFGQRPSSNWNPGTELCRNGKSPGARHLTLQARLDVWRHTPMSSFHRNECVLMKSRISSIQRGSCRTSTSTPRLRNNASSPMNVMFSPTTTRGMR